MGGDTTAAVAHKKQPHSVSAGVDLIEGFGCNDRHPTCNSHFDGPCTKSRKLTWGVRVEATRGEEEAVGVYVCEIIHAVYCNAEGSALQCSFLQCFAATHCTQTSQRQQASVWLAAHWHWRSHPRNAIRLLASVNKPELRSRGGLEDGEVHKHKGFGVAHADHGGGGDAEGGGGALDRCDEVLVVGRSENGEDGVVSGRNMMLNDKRACVEL